MPNPRSKAGTDLRIAVVGATGVVGQTMLKILAERGYAATQVKALASERSAGSRLEYGGSYVPVEALGEHAFDGVDLALFAASSDVALMFAPLAAEAGALVVDNSSAWRMKDNVPLVVPEVNSEDIRENEGIIANPNCCAIPLTVVLKPLIDRVGVERVLVATYQSASGAGKALVDELEEQTKAIAEGRVPEVNAYSHQLAHNVVPGGWKPDAEGYNEEEVKIVNETRKILHTPGLGVTATCVRVPVQVSHGEAVFIETREMISAAQVREVLGQSPGIVVEDDPRAKLFPTPLGVSGKDEVYVGRIRNDLSNSHGIALWLVSDNLRKGAALNAIQVAERAVEMGVL